jgi:DNA topoisomerase-1
MRRLLIWIGLFGVTVWAALRILRAIDRIPARTDATPRTDAIYSVPTPPHTNDPPPTIDDSSPPTDAIDGVPPTDNAIPASDDVALEAYCARCRTRRVLTNVREETTANGRRAGRGACAVCGTTVFTFLPTKQAT